MKKLFLIFHGRYPSEKAASLFAAKSCEAFVEQGYCVTLLVPRRRSVVHRDSFSTYNIPENFTVKYLPTIDLFFVPHLHMIAFLISLVAFSVSTTIYLVLKSKDKDIVYSNEHLPLILASFFRKNTFYEVHDMPERKKMFYRLLFCRLRGVIATNTWKQKKLIEMFQLTTKQVLCEPNGVDLREFQDQISKVEARAELKIASDARIVLYTGHLYSWKGVDTLAEAAAFLDDVIVYCVGGTKDDIYRFKERYGTIKNLHIVGHRPHREISLWQKAADIAVLPNTGREDISVYYTSPMKLFEYMASGLPIVASDLPSITEILNKENAVLISPDDPNVLASAILSVFKNRDNAKKIAIRAMSDVEEHTWQKRAGRIMKFIQSQSEYKKS